MRALQAMNLDGPDGLELTDVEEPGADGRHPTLGEPGVVIEVHAAGVAFPDLLLTRGEYQMRLDPPFTPGVEVAGIVRSAPAGAAVRPGDRVAAYTLTGGFAEVAVAPAWGAFPLPDALDMGQGAGLVLNTHTAHFALVRRGGLREGETVLVHGAAGGVGTAAIQVARGLGARVLAVVSSEEKAALAREAGAQETLDSAGEWRKQARELTGGRGVDVVLDPVGGDRFTDSLRSLAPEGRLLVVGFAEGTIPEVRVNRLLLTNTEVRGVGWGAFIQAHPEVSLEIGEGVNRLADEGWVKPLVTARFPLERGADALRLIGSRGALGKVVLDVR